MSDKTPAEQSSRFSQQETRGRNPPPEIKTPSVLRQSKTGMTTTRRQQGENPAHALAERTTAAETARVRVELQEYTEAATTAPSLGERLTNQVTQAQGTRNEALQARLSTEQRPNVLAFGMIADMAPVTVPGAEPNTRYIGVELTNRSSLNLARTEQFNMIGEVTDTTAPEQAPQLIKISAVRPDGTRQVTMRDPKTGEQMQMKPRAKDIVKVVEPEVSDILLTKGDQMAITEPVGNNTSLYFLKVNRLVVYDPTKPEATTTFPARVSPLLKEYSTATPPQVSSPR